MPSVDDFVNEFISMPSGSGHLGLQRDAANAVRWLVDRACGWVDDDSELAHLRYQMQTAPFPASANWLRSPLMFQALHGLSDFNPVLKDWHARVATPCMQDLVESTDQRPHGYMGNFLLCLMLRKDQKWRGQVFLRTDLYGRLTFPESNWRIALYNADAPEPEVLERQLVALDMDGNDARFRLPETDEPFMIMSQAALYRLLDDQETGIDFRASSGQVTPHLYRTMSLRRSPVVYDPILFDQHPEHAGVTGAFVERILMAISEFSPAMYTDYCRYIVTLRGFELPAFDGRTIGSFSDPISPGVMSVNIPCTDDHAPRVTPFCFTWFAHELAHTKWYLIDTIAYRNESYFVKNLTEATPIVSRYERALPIRTLIQIPFVHLYEWELLMDVYETGLHLLPWVIEEDPIAFGNEIQSEIDEGFELISTYARLTELGNAALRHQLRLYDQLRKRWSALCQASVIYSSSDVIGTSSTQRD